MLYERSDFTSFACLKPSRDIHQIYSELLFTVINLPITAQTVIISDNWKPPVQKPWTQTVSEDFFLSFLTHITRKYEHIETD